VPSANYGIINSITKLHLVGISTESATMYGSINMKFLVNSVRRPFSRLIQATHPHVYRTVHYAQAAAAEDKVRSR
jgi:hypothetical protein